MVRNVVVTGAAQGIGYHIALGFAKQGDRVFALDVLEASFPDPGITFIRTDLSDSSQVRSSFAEINEACGAIQVLINNAGISKFHKPVQQITAEEFDRVIAVNLRGTFLCAQEFIASNEGEDYGRIINISSTRYHQNEPGWEAYGASKGAVVSLTNSLCVSLAGTPITVNAISPGWIEVNAYDKLSAQDHQQHPSGRVGKASDIVNACIFFAEPGNDFINGANLLIDGGMTKRMIYDNSGDFWEGT